MALMITDECVNCENNGSLILNSRFKARPHLRLDYP